jgi:hypothetical protein
MPSLGVGDRQHLGTGPGEGAGYLEETAAVGVGLEHDETFPPGPTRRRTVARLADTASQIEFAQVGRSTA